MTDAIKMSNAGQWSVPITYTLTGTELELIATHTREIIDYNEEHGYVNTWPVGEESDWHLKFRGFAAELAASKLTGLEWRRTMFGSGFHERKAHDIGRRTEVRNAGKDDGRLAYKPPPHGKDSPKLVYLLMVGYPPTFRLAGWLEGVDMAEMPLDENVQWPAKFAAQWQLHPLPLPDDA